MSSWPSFKARHAIFLPPNLRGSRSKGIREWGGGGGEGRGVKGKTNTYYLLALAFVMNVFS